jgi:hypothetical protein
MRTSYYVAGGILAAAGLLLAFNAFNLRTLARDWAENQGLIEPGEGIGERLSRERNRGEDTNKSYGRESRPGGSMGSRAGGH